MRGGDDRIYISIEAPGLGFRLHLLPADRSKLFGSTSAESTYVHKAHRFCLVRFSSRMTRHARPVELLKHASRRSM